MKLLIADDSVTFRMMLASVAKKWGYEVVEVEDGQQAWLHLLEADSADLVILDWEMPKISGVELCQRIRGENDSNFPYILLLTSRTESSDLIEGLEKGANDYISKPFNGAELKARLQVGARMVEMQIKLNKTLKELKFKATYDSLTGALNRGAILSHLASEAERVRRHKDKLCIGMCDIDYFKKINDLYGHLVGDEVLKEITRRMEAVIRPYDLIGRYGGEEFLIVASYSDGELLNVFERLRETITDTPIIIGKESINVSISCGVSKLRNKDEINNLDSLISRADQALYNAKDSGRNKVVWYDDTEI